MTFPILKTLALASLLALGTAGAVSAQAPDAGTSAADGAERDRPCHRGRRGRHIRAALRQLDLSDAQKAEIRTIMRDARTNGRALRDLEPEQRRQARRDLRQETRTRIEGVLTAEQQAELEGLREARQERREARGQRGRRDR